MELKSLRALINCIEKGVWPAALSFERRRSRNFLVLTCVRKLADLCLALDLAVTVRWIPSEVNMPDRPSRIHDPSDIRDKTVTHLLTTVLKSRTNRDKLDAGMMVQRCHRVTNPVIRNRNGASSTNSGATKSCHRTVGGEEHGTVTTHWPPKKIQRQTVADVTSDGTVDEHSKGPPAEISADDLKEEDVDDPSSTDMEVIAQRKQRRLEGSVRRRARTVAQVGKDLTFTKLVFLQREFQLVP